MSEFNEFLNSFEIFMEEPVDLRVFELDKIQYKRSYQKVYLDNKMFVVADTLELRNALNIL